MSEIRFKYSDSSRGLFNNWEDLLYFWSHYYSSRAETDRRMRKKAYGVAVDKQGMEIIAAPVFGPLTIAQKADLLERAAEYVTGLKTIE